MENPILKKKMKAALYIRVSTEDQAREGYSLSIQKDYLIDFAQRQDWQIHFSDGKDKIYEDDGYSGYSLDRPALSQLMEDARSKKFDLVLVYKLDRFSRRLKDLLNILDELDNLGVEFKSATEPYETTSSSGKLMLQQLGSFAEFERNRIIERVVPGMVRGVKDGHWQGARYSPFGYYYDKTKKKLILVENEAQIVREIFQKYLSGLSTQKIAGELYNRGLSTRSGGPFASSLVRKILRNKIYIGKLLWNVHHYDRKQRTLHGFRYIKNDPSKIIEAEGRHEPIIREEDFYLAQSLLDRNRNGVYTRHREREYPLSGVIKCAICNFPYNGVSNVKNHRTGEKRPYYRCSGRARHNIKCGNHDVRAEILESEVFGIFDILFSAECISKERLRNLVTAQHREQATDLVSQEFDKLNRDLQTCLLKQGKLTDVYLETAISREIFHEKNKQLRNEEGEIRIKIERVELQLIKKEESREYIRKAQEIVRSSESFRENLHPSLRKELLTLVFKKLSVKDQRISEFELYEPFNAMYQSALAAKKEKSSEERRDENWKQNQKQIISAAKSQSCISPPLVVK